MKGLISRDRPIRTEAVGFPARPTPTPDNSSLMFPDPGGLRSLHSNPLSASAGRTNHHPEQVEECGKETERAGLGFCIFYSD